MTPIALHPCATPGCPTLIRSGSHCPEHEATRRKHDPEQRRFYSSQRWRQISLLVRKQEPVCRICQVRPSTNTDHIDGDWRNNARENLRALCTECNRTHTARQHREKA